MKKRGYNTINTHFMRKRDFLSGLKAGIPISFGYLAIMIAIGIQARAAGMGVGYALMLSFTNVTSAGEVEAIRIIGEHGTYMAIFLVTLIMNLRYVLMSASLAPRVGHMPIYQKMILAYGLTDEIFAVSVTRREKLSVWFTLGIYSTAVPMWLIGTATGAILGDKLPEIVILSLQVCLFGMFLSIVLPPAKEHKNIRCAVILSMALNGVIELIQRIPGLEFFKAINDYRIIIVVVVVSAFLSIVMPIKKGEAHA